MSQISYEAATLIGAFLECVMYGEHLVPPFGSDNSCVIVDFIV